MLIYLSIYVVVIWNVFYKKSKAVFRFVLSSRRNTMRSLQQVPFIPSVQNKATKKSRVFVEIYSGYSVYFLCKEEGMNGQFVV